MNNHTLRFFILSLFFAGLVIGYFVTAYAQDASSGYADNGEAYARGKGEQVMFCEYEFLEYCEERYLNCYCSQEEAITLQELGLVSEKTRDVSPWQLVVWLGEYLSKKEASHD